MALGPSFSSTLSRRTSATSHSRLASLPGVDAARLGGGDTLHLPLAAQVGLEFGEHAQHVEEGLSRRCRGVDRLLGRP